MLELSDPGKTVDINALPAGSGSTPVFAGQHIYLRGGKFLYCLGAH
jgi:hypothetical protein